MPNFKTTKILKPILFLLISIVLVWGFSWRIAANLQRVKGSSTNISSSQIISLTNLERTRNDLEPLSPSDQLNQAAKQKALDMIARDYFDHTNPDGEGPWVVINDQGYIYHFAGENLARNFSTSEAVLEAWLNSPQHKDNLLSQNYTQIGIAVETTQDETYIVQLLASPVPQELLGQIEGQNTQNFIITTPITNKKTHINSNLLVSLISFFVTIATIIIVIFLMILIKKHNQSIAKPSMKFWTSKK